MRALVLACVVLGAAVAHADGPRTTPFGYDHLLHQRNLDVKGKEPLACIRCHTESKGKAVPGASLPRQAPALGHAACFTDCHEGAPKAPKRGTKVVFGDRVKVCTSCHAPAAEGTTFTGKLAVGYPPFGLDPDFNISFGHKQHGTVACAQCHDMRDKPLKRAAHDRCAGCHDGSNGKGRGPAMSQCVGCHPQAIGKPEPPALAVVKDTVTASFSHPAHAARSAAGRECVTCHPTIATTDETQLPRPTMASCGVGACHDGKTAFASTSACTRCHTTAPTEYKVFRTTARFEHSGDHAKVVTDRPCSACHPLGADGNAKRASHDACVECHAADFAKRQPEKCSACHNATEPWRHLVADRPLPDRTEFGVTIDHDKHPQDCVRCHSLRTATQQLRPPRGHASCMGDGCHAAKGGPTPTIDLCSGCHRGGLAEARTTARTKSPWSVRTTFQHATHTTGADGAALACKSCHTKLSGSDTLALPTPAKATCLPCHDRGKQAFSLTGTTCSRCHPAVKGGATTPEPEKPKAPTTATPRAPTAAAPPTVTK